MVLFFVNGIPNYTHRPGPCEPPGPPGAPCAAGTQPFRRFSKIDPFHSLKVGSCARWAVPTAGPDRPAESVGPRTVPRLSDPFPVAPCCTPRAMRLLAVLLASAACCNAEDDDHSYDVSPPLAPPGSAAPRGRSTATILRMVRDENAVLGLRPSCGSTAASRRAHGSTSRPGKARIQAPPTTTRTPGMLHSSEEQLGIIRTGVLSQVTIEILENGVSTARGHPHHNLTPRDLSDGLRSLPGGPQRARPPGQDRSLSRLRPQVRTITPALRLISRDSSEDCL